MSKLLTKFSLKLWPDPQQQQAFIQALTEPQPYSPCIAWIKGRSEKASFQRVDALPWQLPFVDRLAVGERPGKHDLHHQGAYYCLDFSSVFAATPLTVIRKKPNIVLDLCAAPGGKSLLAWRFLQPHLLVSNEVIGKRVGMLISNLKRCQVKPVRVLSADPSVLAEAIPASADVVLVDAPCSGQSLLAKGESAPGCFHPASIQHNVKRQRRILANASRLVVPGGYLAYMTCAFSEAENERVCRWFARRFPHFEPQTVNALLAFQSHLTDLPCYRIWPQSGLGAGAFTMLFRNTQGTESMARPLEAWLDENTRWSSE